MKILKAAWLPLFLILSTQTTQADVIDEITSALRSGNIEKLETYFGKRIELELADGTVYSKNRDEVRQALSNFFLQNPAKTVNIKHRGPNGKQGFIIFSYVSKAGTQFRLTIYTEGEGENLRIRELKLENS